MALSRFNKFLVLSGYAVQKDLESGSIVMNRMMDVKKLMKEFKTNENNIKLYYIMRGRGETSGFKYNNVKNNLILY